MVQRILCEHNLFLVKEFKKRHNIPFLPLPLVKIWRKISTFAPILNNQNTGSNRFQQEQLDYQSVYVGVA